MSDGGDRRADQRTADQAKSVDRRAFLRGIFGRGASRDEAAGDGPHAKPDEPPAALPLEAPVRVLALDQVLREHVADLPWGLPPAMLPEPREQLEEALTTFAESDDGAPWRKQVGELYGGLEWFLDDATLAELTEGRVCLEGRRFDDEGREKITEAFEIRNAILARVAGLERDFAERVGPPVAPDPPPPEEGPEPGADPEPAPVPEGDGPDR